MILKQDSRISLDLNQLSGIQKLHLKRIIWKGIINNKIKILVGARSALLLPFKKLGIIIVDEEHDTSYKQDEGSNIY